MKVILAFDSFKGSLTASQACNIAAEAIKNVRNDIEIIQKPMADGGEGTAHALIADMNGKWIQHQVQGPLPDVHINAGYAWFEKEKLALVEMAAASGITLLKKDQLNPLKTNTYGTGELIRAAMSKNPAKLLLAVGGSATVDGGTAAAQALGWEFLDKDGNTVPPGGEGLQKIAKIRKPQKNLINCPVEVLSDVDNPLCGPEGAAYVYGPQKGADPQMVKILDSGLEKLANVIARDIGINVLSLPGAGAAGGLGAAAAAFMNARIVPGIEKIMHISGLTEQIKNADWILTGEGKFDSQSLRGKVVSGIVKNAKTAETKVGIIAGQVTVNQQQYQNFGISAVLSCLQKGMSIEYALNNCENLIKQRAAEFAKNYF